MEVRKLLLNFVYGLIGIILLTAFCLIGAFSAPQVAYWCMTPKAKKLLEEYGISRKFSLKGKILLAILTVIIGILYVITIVCAGKQGVASGMDFWQLALRFVIFFWMISIFDAVALDWWMFTKTKIFGILIKMKTGKTPAVWSVEPQWDGKEIHRLIIEVIVSAVLAWLFLKVFH
ncbi:MAG: hypothetical protein K5705_07760 [Oscillospiraceae bacterium]|nr:hypothetical protein [Oscillospiraceae bacterium]